MSNGNEKLIDEILAQQAPAEPGQREDGTTIVTLDPQYYNTWKVEPGSELENALLDALLLYAQARRVENVQGNEYHDYGKDVIKLKASNRYLNATSEEGAKMIGELKVKHAKEYTTKVTLARATLKVQALKLYAEAFPTPAEPEPEPKDTQEKILAELEAVNRETRIKNALEVFNLETRKLTRDNFADACINAMTGAVSAKDDERAEVVLRAARHKALAGEMTQRYYRAVVAVTADPEQIARLERCRQQERAIYMGVMRRTDPITCTKINHFAQQEVIPELFDSGFPRWRLQAEGVQ